MVAYSRLREIISDMTFKDSLLIYDTYFQISAVPEKRTFSGQHEEKMMFSFGLRFNDEKAKQFFNSDNPLKQQIIERMSKQLNITQENIISSYKTGKLKDLLISAVEMQIKALGIPVILLKKEAAFEVYSYIKTSDTDEILHMLQAMIIALGRSVALFESQDKEKKLVYYEMSLKMQIEKLLRKGFNIGNDNMQ